MFKKLINKFFKPTTVKQCSGCNESLKRRVYRTLAQDVMAERKHMQSWVKNAKFQFCEIGEKAANILYGKSSNECIGFTDYDIAKQCGCTLDEAKFKEICRASDLYLTVGKPEIFMEIIDDTRGGKHLWLTIKSKELLMISDDGNPDIFYTGTAIFQDVLKGSYEKALEDFQKEINSYEKINDNLYILKK